MTEAGFVVEEMLRFNRMSRPGWWLNGKILNKTDISRFQLKNFDRLVWLWRRIDKFLPWRPVSIIAIGRKPASKSTPEWQMDRGSRLAPAYTADNGGLLGLLDALPAPQVDVAPAHREPVISSGSESVGRHRVDAR